MYRVSPCQWYKPHCNKGQSVSACMAAVHFLHQHHTNSVTGAGCNLSTARSTCQLTFSI